MAGNIIRAGASPAFAPALARARATVEAFTPPGSGPKDLGAGAADKPQPLVVVRSWRTHLNRDQLLAWVRAHKPAGLVPVTLPAPKPTPCATEPPFDADDVHWTVPARPDAPAGLLTANISPSRNVPTLTVILTQGWVDPRPALVPGRPTQPRYAVRDAATCPRMPSISHPWFAIGGRLPDPVEGAVNTGYDTATRLMPDETPTGALRCRYGRQGDLGDVSRSPEAEQRLGAQAAAHLTRDLGALPTAYLWDDDDSPRMGGSLGYVIFTYAHREPVTISFLGNGLTNGDLLIAQPNPRRSSPLYPAGTAAAESLFVWR